MKEPLSRSLKVTSSLNEISTDQLSPYFKPFKAPRNRFPAWRAGTTTIFVVPAHQATQAREIDALESIPGLLKRLQIRALASC
jgi:hypothetical protein